MAATLDEAARPATPLDYHRLDSLRSQDAVVLPPSMPTTTTGSPSSPIGRQPFQQQIQHTLPQAQLQSPSSPSQSEKIIDSSTPSTPPSRVVPTFHFAPDNQVKRDSGIDHSTSTSATDHCSPPPIAASPLQYANVVREPRSLPSIFVHDAQPPKSSRSNRSFFRKFSRDADGLPAPEEESADVAANSGHRKIRSFHGIDLDIPTETGFEDLNQPEKLQFSNRGSVLLNGHKLAAMADANSAADADADAQTDGVNHDAQETVSLPDASNMPAKGTGLKTGRRKPSVHLLQAVLQGSRVLSAEEVTFSRRVRTMYEYGDEKAADWSVSDTEVPSFIASEHSPIQEESFERDTTPEPDASALVIDHPRKRPQTTGRTASANNPESRMSYIAREPNERAGGIEDWNGLDSLPPGSVDRYGFIKPTRVKSTDTASASLAAPDIRPAMQRVSTSLQMMSNNPRQPRRGIFRGASVSSKRYSRSLPPSRADSRHTSRTTANSIYSYRSSHSTVRVHNPFRSRERRILEEASDMLTLPADLGNVKQVDNDVYHDHLRRREWGREKKWHEMARRVPSDQKGGGMKFDFDVRDPKLVARTWKGIPDRWRATAWHSFLSTSARKRGCDTTDDTLIRLFFEYQEQSSADDVQIDVDVPRTINMHVMFRRRYRGGQRLLFRVLHAISLHFPETGYVQGMAALAATLLCYYDEEMAFVMLVRMWQLRGLEELYRSGFEGLMAALEEFNTQWLANDAEVSERLIDLGIDPTAYGTRWYLTLFNMSIPFPAQLRIWDVYMLLGDAPRSQLSHASTVSVNAPTKQQKGRFGGADLSVLHAASAAIVEAMRVVLLDSDFENSMKVLTSWVPVQDEDTLMRVARAEWKIGMRNRRREGKIMS